MQSPLPGGNSIGEGAEVWLGYSQTLRPVQRGITMIVDLSATVRVPVPPAVHR